MERARHIRCGICGEYFETYVRHRSTCRQCVRNTDKWDGDEEAAVPEDDYNARLALGNKLLARSEDDYDDNG